MTGHQHVESSRLPPRSLPGLAACGTGRVRPPGPARHPGPAVLAAARHRPRDVDDPRRRPAPLGAVRGVARRGDLEAFLRRSPVAARWRDEAAGAPGRYGSRRSTSRGRWGGADPFGGAARRAARGPSPDGPVAVLTRASIRPARLAAFYRAVPEVDRVLREQEGRPRLGRRRRVAGRPAGHVLAVAGRRPLPVRLPTAPTRGSSAASAPATGTPRSCSPGSSRFGSEGTWDGRTRCADPAPVTTAAGRPPPPGRGRRRRPARSPRPSRSRARRHGAAQPEKRGPAVGARVVAGPHRASADGVAMPAAATMPSVARTHPSTVFSTTLPVNPSVTITSTVPATTWWPARWT